MTQPAKERLYALLPALYRRRDLEQGEALRAFFAVLEEQFDAVQGDIRQLYDNWFIETCAEWVVPYIGDALGVQLAHPFAGEGLTLRAYIANTLGLRRRKGTAGTLERVAQDVSGWPAAAVEYFQLLAATQNVDHVRPAALGTANLRDSVALDLLGGAFERAPYTADLRSIAAGRGRYGISNVGIFLWTLRSLKAEQVMATVATDAPTGSGSGFFRLSPLGQDQALWNPRDTAARLDVRQSEAQVPAPLRRVPLYQRFNALRASLAATPNVANPDSDALSGLFQFTLDGVVVRPDQIAICNLATWHRPAAGPTPTSILLAVDPVSGRIALPASAPPTTELLVTYYYGAPAEIGGGSYGRAPFDDGLISPVVQTIPPAPRSGQIAVDTPRDELATALQQYSAKAAATPPTTPAEQVIEIEDSFTYALVDLTVPAGAHLQIRAARVGPERPLLVGEAQGAAAPTWTVTLGAGARLTLEGLWIAASLHVTAADLAQVTLVHSTLVPGVALSWDGSPRFPGTASLQFSGDHDVHVVIKHSILGPLLMSATVGSADVEDSLIDGGVGPALQASDLAMKRSTVFGGTTARAISIVEDSLFTTPLIVQRSQEGCVRFSFVPSGSSTPRQFHCQPQLALAALPSPHDPSLTAMTIASMLPAFSSMRYGEPGYGRLTPSCPAEIAAGGSDGSEMGAYQILQIPKRNSNLQAALSEYLRFGLEVGSFPALR